MCNLVGLELGALNDHRLKRFYPLGHCQFGTNSLSFVREPLKVGKWMQWKTATAYIRTCGSVVYVTDSGLRGGGILPH